MTNERYSFILASNWMGTAPPASLGISKLAKNCRP